MNTPLDLDAIRKRLDKASPGPWTAVHGDKHNAYPCVCIKSKGKELLVWDIADDAPAEFPGRDEDADFVANAREDILALISKVEALTKVITDQPPCAVCAKPVSKLSADPGRWDAAIHHYCLRDLRAKLERAKEALVDLRNAETNGSIRYNGILGSGLL